MSIRPTQKVVFINNKWWVWKTTLAYNVACKLSELWNKVLLVDGDPQCNLTLLGLWVNQYEELWLFKNNTIYNVVENLIKWIGDYQLIQPTNLRPNLDILPWNLNFTDFDDLLTTSYGEIIGSASAQRWFTVVSALQRYLNEISLINKYNIVIIDASPSMTGSLNKTILLSSDFFVTICNPDLFSKQWIVNLWTKIKKRRDEQRNIINIADRSGVIPWWSYPKWEHSFIWYVLNNYNVYNQEPISTHGERLSTIEPEIQDYLCELSKNWLVIKSKDIMGMTQDYGKIPGVSQKRNIPLYEVSETELWWAEGSVNLLHKCQEEVNNLTQNLITRLEKRGV